MKLMILSKHEHEVWVEVYELWLSIARDIQNILRFENREVIASA